MILPIEFGCGGFSLWAIAVSVICGARSIASTLTTAVARLSRTKRIVTLLPLGNDSAIVLDFPGRIVGRGPRNICFGRRRPNRQVDREPYQQDSRNE